MDLLPTEFVKKCLLTSHNITEFVTLLNSANSVHMNKATKIDQRTTIF